MIDEALATEDPANPDAEPAPPPVPPESLRIAATGVDPSQTPAVEPQPVESHMDEAFRHRRVPQRPGQSVRREADPPTGRGR